MYIHSLDKSTLSTNVTDWAQTLDGFCWYWNNKYIGHVLCTMRYNSKSYSIHYPVRVINDKISAKKNKKKFTCLVFMSWTFYLIRYTLPEYLEVWVSLNKYSVFTTILISYLLIKIDRVRDYKFHYVTNNLHKNTGLWQHNL